MGFLSKIRNNMQNKVSKMPRSDMGFRDMGPGNMPRRPDIFGGNSFLFGRKPDMTSIRMPQKRSGGFGGSLREAIRRLQEQGGMGMPRMEGSTDMGMPRMEGRPINQYMGSPGGTPGFYDNMRENMSPGQRLEQRPNFGMEQMPIARRDPSALERLPMGGAPSFNPTIFGQPIPQGADFSNMPDFSQIDMSQLDLSGIPQSISQMNLPQMPEGLPSMEEIQGNRRMPQMGMGEMQPRMMMAEGDEVMMMQENEMMAPNGGEIENMLSGMDSGEQEAMGELEQMAPEMEMIDQLVMMVAQMIQQGAGEEEVIMFLREQGLDDEDIGTVLQLVAEMAETEEMAEDEIGNELEQLA
jgi:hypothetical protein